MVAGADKVIVYDPPGAIGLYDREAVFQMRLNEVDDSERPQDVKRLVDDFDVLIDPAVVMPAVVDAVLGRGREFGGQENGLAARDKEPGATLLTRDMSIQVVLLWECATQDAVGTPGTIIARGLGGSAAEYLAYGLQLDVVSVGSFVGKLRWFWQDIAGVHKLQAGADVVLRPGTFTMLTATRRWISPTSVELCYYVGDQLIERVASTDGSIGGGTTGAMQLGYRRVTGTPNNFFAGVLDEIMVVDRVMTREEIEATWLRITVYQPRGEQLLLEMIDPGFPLPDDPRSDARKDIRMFGQLFGFAAAITENLRANFLPNRAYGSTLEQWEEALRPTPKPGSDIETRRARCVSRLRQRRGISIDGLKDVLVDLLGSGTVGDLEFIAFDNTITEPFTTLDELRWEITPLASWTAPAGTARSSLVAGSYVFDGFSHGWRRATMCVGGLAKEARLLAKVAMTTPQQGLEVGLFFGEAVAHDYLLLGLRNDAGTYKIVSESFVNRVSQGVTTHATLGGNPANLWLHLWQTVEHAHEYKAAWSTTSAKTGYTTSSPISHTEVARLGGIYVRSTAAIAGAAQVDVDDLIMRAPYGTRTLNGYVLLEGFDPDLAGAQSVIAAIKHAFTHGTFITSRSVLCDNQESGCDLGPMGAL